MASSLTQLPGFANPPARADNQGMKLTLKRAEFRKDGIFGDLFCDETGDHLASTLEHSYPKGDDFAPKLPDGVYACERGPHRLKADADPFETFEIKGVPGHWGILFHVGNYNRDSQGCVLIGTGIGWTAKKEKMIVGSKLAFDRFMKRLEGHQSFTLTVK